ncbi:MAG: homoserine kinase [Clostridiales bacterium]|nr:homoserine kinase [Clostridiales bacterium]
MISVRVPATSANMGAGFDTLGVALNLYNRIRIEEIPEGLIIENKNETSYIPTDEKNLIYRAILKVFDAAGYEKKGIRIIQNSEIPMTRGLGSSSACIVGGMLAANIISGRKLSYKEIIHLAAQLEGHPDNVGPALYGGFCVSVTENGNTIVKSTKITSGIKFAVMIPDYFVVTRKSREVLPETVSFSDAVYNVSHAALFQSAMVSGDMEALRCGVNDRLHQEYRKAYIDGMEEIFKRTYELGSNATYLSGSGPTILSVLDNNFKQFDEGMKRFFAENEHQWTCRILEADNVGAVVCEERSAARIN